MHVENGEFGLGAGSYHDVHGGVDSPRFFSPNRKPAAKLAIQTLSSKNNMNRIFESGREHTYSCKMRLICGSYFYRALEVLFRRVKERNLCLQALTSGQDFPFGDFFSMAANRFLMLTAFALCAIQLANTGPVPRPSTSCDTQQVPPSAIPSPVNGPTPVQLLDPYAPKSPADPVKSSPPPASNPPAGPVPTYPSESNATLKGPNGPSTNNPVPNGSATTRPVPNDPPKGVPTQGYSAGPAVASSLPVGGPPAKDLPQGDRAPKQPGGSSPLKGGPVTNKSPETAPPSNYLVGPGNHQATLQDREEANIEGERMTQSPSCDHKTVA
ncbi:uncharacterized protein LACBIDRAFT_324522 [Laccaria bicolor S238N-H82]|uniref:Predicted protein n=1 Tax=Laccaria bicolor (strain S238N-H82 / ATCC MYA-4686) TaxID=486041 RepID=B0D258_LACBS|nr:uncharacterized protein LACBIDRAFT_324522 [Laccaria bicolor S238N-H82]EDR11044.1 predicted protein [Laccaria bicolor S238N-H82]|eukprot:XP_001878345.1 predicted protein [Laccaria bicolor S238N-H82]